jgi:hypothetical protein
MVLERGDDPDDWWCRHPENQCSCPHQPKDQRCRCRHCVSWLRRAPRCRRTGCTAYAWVHDDRLCAAHHAEVSERRRVTSQRSAKTRRPPRPPHERTVGACSMCGTTDLPPRRRSWCSDDCVDTWLWATMPKVATSHLLELHGDRCWACDGPGPLELEHVRPLWSLTDAERQQLRWWLPYNLQLLCTGCHAAKTASEAAWRAALKRGEHPRLPWSTTPAA